MQITRTRSIFSVYAVGRRTKAIPLVLTGSGPACLHARMVRPASYAVAAAQPRSAPAQGAKEPLQMRIPVVVKRRFKAHAAMRGLEPNELFVEVWNHYERTVATAAPGDRAQ